MLEDEETYFPMSEDLIGLFDPFARSSWGNESNCGTNHQFDRICWQLEGGAGSWIFWQNVLVRVAAFFSHQKKPKHYS